MDHLGEISKFIEMFEAKMPTPFKENFADFKEIESRLIEIKLPKLMWGVLDAGLKASKRNKIEGLPENIDMLLNDHIISKLFLPKSTEHAEMILGAMREVVIHRTMGNMLGAMRSVIEKSEKHKEKGYE